MADNSNQVSLRTEAGALVASSSDVMKQKVKKAPLEEDEFTETMAKIIRRDFFPDLPKLEAQLEYIEATDSDDPVKLREISERFASGQLNTPHATPSNFRVPGATPSQRKRPPVDSTPSNTKVHKPEDSKSLDEFLNRYQSEDDASFSEIMNIEEEKRKQKYGWMYEREQEADTMNSIIPALTSGNDGPTLAIDGPSDKLAITDGGVADGRGHIKHWKYTAKNTLMYIPEGAESNVKELIQKRNEKEIRHVNTRLPRDYIRQMALMGGAGAESGNVMGGAGREKFGIDGKQINAEASPKVNGYGFVATPQIRPGVDASPMMTWGTIEGTPLHIDTDIVATPGPVFKIPRTPQRDALAHQLAEKASRSIKEKRKIALEKTTSLLKSPIGKSPLVTDRLKLLSPAARKLITSPSGILRHHSDRALRASYTPTTKNKTGGVVATPKAHGNDTPVVSNTLTDNLLDLQNNR